MSSRASWGTFWPWVVAVPLIVACSASDGGRSTNGTFGPGLTSADSGDTGSAAGTTTEPIDTTGTSPGSTSAADSSTGSGAEETGEPPEVLGDFEPDGLAAAFTFNEDAGATVPDLTGNGHDATLQGTYAWEGGTLHQIIQGEEFGFTSIPRNGLMESDWTIQMWFGPHSHAASSSARVFSASDDLGGTGPEFFYRAGQLMAVRINNDGATWDEPAVGSRSNAGPPDHWATAIEPMEEDVITDFVAVHIASEQRLLMYQSLADGGPPELIFDGTYSGTYEMVVGDIRLGHTHRDSEPRPFDASFDQLLIYERALSIEEITHNHTVGTD